MRSGRRITIAAVVAALLGTGIAGGFWATSKPAPDPALAAVAPATTTKKKKPKKPRKPPEAPRVLFGEVLGRDGAPLVGATVRVERGPDAPVAEPVRTGVDGHFTLDAFPADAALIFGAAGYLDARVEADTLPRAAEAFWSQQLSPAGESVRLRVVVDDASRAPIAGAVVAVSGVDGAAGTSDEAGVVVLKGGVINGAAWVAHAEHGVRKLEAPPGSPASGPLGPGGGGDVVVALPASAILDGVVVDDRGRPVPGASLQVGVRVNRGGPDELLLLRRLLRRRPAVVVDDGSGGGSGGGGGGGEGASGGVGRFRFPVAAGPLQVTGAGRGVRPGEPLEVDTRPGQVTTLRVVLSASPKVAGVVVDADTGRPVAGAIVQPDGAFAGARAATSNRDGRFVLDSLDERPLSVTVRHDGYRPLTLGGLDGGRDRQGSLRIELHPGDGSGGGAGDVVGIGVTVARADDGLRLRDISPGSPAERAGLRRGDVIVEVDGARLEGNLLADMARVRGQAGTRVSLVARRPGRRGAADQTLAVDVERALIAIPEG